MVRLLLKIFLAYWIAAGVVIVISDFEPHRHIHNPELTDALDTALVMDGRTMIDAYEGGRCSEAQKRFTSDRNGLYLAAPDGKLLCGDVAAPDAKGVIAAAVQQKKRMTASDEWFQLVAVPIQSSRGTPYVLVLKSGYKSALQLDGLLPGYTTIAISCVVTLFLGFLMALPIRRLRTAAGEIAMGKFDARVRWNSPTARFTGGDDIDQLCTDFNHMAEHLQSLADAQRLLLCEVSHELRSPLTRLSVGLGLARSESSPAMQVHLDRIGAEAVRLNCLIDQVLSLSRLDLLHEIEAPGVTSLSELVVDLLPDVQYEASQSDCVIDAAICPGCYVRCDRELLRTAIENIVRNAIKYTGSGGLIQVETVCEALDGKEMSIVRVSDNGPGVPEHELRSVLKPFYRADRSRHWQQDGSGIGLAIADRAAKLHDGAIVLRNKPEGGLIVEIRIPSVAPPPQESAAEADYAAAMLGD